MDGRCDLGQRPPGKLVLPRHGLVGSRPSFWWRRNRGGQRVRLAERERLVESGADVPAVQGPDGCEQRKIGEILDPRVRP